VHASHCIGGGAWARHPPHAPPRARRDPTADPLPPLRLQTARPSRAARVVTRAGFFGSAENIVRREEGGQAAA
jgi:hypothetical protein